ncbi:hypothetical protein PG994_014736 [Apiospora phragmitis]|uniref:Uncharacterized protein n=1 Tax=Apiospora phragmitis TaxID=2905665 RepID=A0ABR1SW64_9PEZI
MAHSPLRRTSIVGSAEPLQATGMISHSRKVTPTGIVLPKSPAATAAHTSRTAIPTLYSQTNNENVPPNGSKESLKTRYKPFGSLPKSRTLNVFSNLTASLSRGSLPSFSRTPSMSSTAGAGGRADQRSRTASIASSQEAEVVHPRHVTGAQSCEYWTGRFMALQDRFHSEMLLPENLTTLITAYAERSHILPPPPPPPHPPSRTVNISTSSSIPNLSYPNTRRHNHTSSISSPSSNRASRDLDAALLMDEDNRARRVFLHLEALCITKEAKQSLHTWQHNYARRMGKECLLPKGESSRGWVGRLLGKNDHGSKRGSLIGVF